MAISGSIVADAVVGVAALSSGVYLAAKRVKEHRAEKKGLLPNPERCEKHESRLGELEVKAGRFDERFLSVHADITEIKDDVKELLRRK
jgi:hypothetical protein